MLERMSGTSLEGWRMRRARRLARGRAPRAVVLGEEPLAFEVAGRLAACRVGEVVLSGETRTWSDRAAIDLGGAVRPVARLEGAAPADALVVCSDDPANAREAALWAARTCPWTALILAARGGLALCAEAARASGLAPWLILSPGGMPHAAAEASRLARQLDLSASQISVPVIGGDGPGGTRVVRRYVTVAGIPASEIEAGGPAVRTERGDARITERALAACALVLACAVLEDERRILSCGAWVEGAWGLPGAFVTAPVPVGARGAEEPPALRLTLEERAFLQAAAI